MEDDARVLMIVFSLTLSALAIYVSLYALIHS